MTLSVKCKVGFRAQPARPTRVRETANSGQVCRAARMLALAYYIDRIVEAGQLKDYADAARRLGLTRPRISQIVNLLNLPVPTQEALLTGKLYSSERSLRQLKTDSQWL